MARLIFEFHPAFVRPGEESPDFSGEGRLTLRMDGIPIWSEEIGEGLQEGVDEYWDGLLLHLAKNWLTFQAEQGYPLGFNPFSPANFLDTALAKLDWAFDLPERLYPMQREIIAFSDRHNLAAGMPDIHLSPVFLLREGNQMRVATEQYDLSLPIRDALQILEKLGEDITKAISNTSSRGRYILDVWEKRQSCPSDITMLSMVTGIPERQLQNLGTNDGILALFGQPSLLEPTPMQIAARMTRHILLPNDLKAVLKRVSNLRLTPLVSQFIRLRDQVMGVLAGILEERPYTQGYFLAKWLRAQLGCSDSQIVEPGDLLSQWGVSISRTQVSEDVDAVARWDVQNAGILVNRWGLRARTVWGQRVTLAHEMAHLLIDTEQALPSVEILGGCMPLIVEQRANAFAAEFLVPRSHIEQAMPQSPTPQMLDQIMETISDHFSVGRILVARQIENLLADRNQLDDSCRNHLDRLSKRYADSRSSEWLAI